MAKYSPRRTGACRSSSPRSSRAFASGARQSRHSPLFRRRALCALMYPARLSGASLLAALLLASPAHANPQGGTVTAGSASIQSATPQRLDIVQKSDKAIINWKGFSIDKGEQTNFNQPSKSSVTLNRVTGAQASQLDGKLTANGIVMLINPSGVVIGPHGRVDVGGLVATTANIRDADFLAGKLDFNQPSLNRDAAVSNAGHITVRGQGLAALVAPRVQNSGVIEAKLGRVALGGARTFKLDFHGDGLLSFSVGSQVNEAPRDAEGKPAKALVENSGKIDADGGTIVLAASAVKDVVDQVINTDGIIEARSIDGRDGRIVLSGGDAGTVQIAGSVDASSGDGRGGSVKIDGEHIVVADGAHVDASGEHGGGTVNIGGADIHGAVANTVDVARGARIEADAIANGDGGSATVLSAVRTRFAGDISARGGDNGGDGGRVEVSSRDKLQMGGTVDLRAPKGNTGELLLDPTTITITDAASGGSLDGNAGDASVGGGDADAGANTISRGLLEGLAATANITLEATGLITVNAMSGNLIDLATDGSHAFTLRSTTSGGIRFIDATTEIRTQGGDIVLQALGSGALTNIGKLTSNGGDIALTAGGGIQLANLVNAGAGNVAATSLTNSIQSTINGKLAGNRVAVNAAYGNIGAVGAPVRTNSANLALSTGGNLILANDAALNSLSIASVHTMNQAFAFQITAPQLNFSVTDNGSVYALGNIVNTTPLDFTFNGDRGIVVGTIGAGTGNVSLTAPAAIADDGDPLTGITALNLVLNAQGAIGDTNAALTTAVASLDARGRGGVYLDNTGPLSLLVLSNNAGARITSTGTLTLGTIASPSLDLTSSGGSIVSATGESISSQTLNLTAGGGSIGSLATPIKTVATQMSANASGDIYIDAATSLSLGNSSSNGGQVNIAANNGNLSLSALNSGATGNVVLKAPKGWINGNGSDPVTANTLDFTTSDNGFVSLVSAVTTVTGTAGSGGVVLNQTGPLTLSAITTTGPLAVNASGGDVTLGAIKAGNSASIATSDGNIIDDGNTATEVEAQSVTLSALLGNLGTNLSHLRSKATALTLSSGGNIFIDNDVPLETLIVTSTHPTAGARTFTVTVPYLAFDVIDTGSQYTINQITGLTLDTLSFTGDQTIVVGRVHATGSAAIAATIGDILNDSDSSTRIRGSSVALRSDQGSIGTAAANGQIDVDTTNLSGATAGNLYINDIADLSQLNFISTHGTPTADYQFVLHAPSLTFDVVDSSAGYTINNISDVTGLNMLFRGDRTIAAHTIDLTRNGTLTLTTTDGSLLDDGDKNTRLLASSVTLNSYAAAVGSTVGNGYMDVVARTLSGTSTTNFTVRLPYPANDQNTSATTLSSINAGGPLDVRLDNGDLRVGSVSSDGAVNLVASNGSLGLTGGNINASDLQLTASGAIGALDGALQLGVPGTVVANAADGGIYFNDSNSIGLLTASAAGPIVASGGGDIVLGAINAGSDLVSITANNSLQDDGDSTTRVVGGTLELTAQQGSIGANGAPVGVTSDEVALGSGGDVHVDDSVGLIALSITGTSSSQFQSNPYEITAPGLTFNVVDDGSTVLLADIANTAPLAFVFSAQRTLVVGGVDTNGGSATLTAVQGNIVDDANAATTLSAPTVALAAAQGSIGATGAGNAIATNASSLTLTAPGNFFVASTSALNTLAITSTGGTNTFGITAGGGQTFTLSDNGSRHYLQTATGAGLANFSFAGQKSIDIGTITTGGAVSITTTGFHNYIHMDGVGGSRVTGGSVLFDTTGTAGGEMGTSGTNLAVSTPVLTANSSGNVYISDNLSLGSLTLDARHAGDDNYASSIGASNIGAFSIADGTTAALNNITATNMNFSYTSNRAIQVGTINVGSGTASLVTNANFGGIYPNPAITDDGNNSTRITASAVGLVSRNYKGSVGTSGTGDIDVTTANLSIGSPGDVYVSNNTTLNSLALDVTHSESGNRTYSVTSTGLAFNVADQSIINNSQGTSVNNVTQSGLNFSFATDRTLQVSTINVGSGAVALDSNFIQDDANNSTKITANSLALTGGGAGSPTPSNTTEIDTNINVLTTDLTQSLYLNNDGNLMFGANKVAQSAVVTSLNGSLFADGASTFEATNLTLIADHGSLGTIGTRLQVDAKTLTLRTGNDFFIDSLDDLSALTVSNFHDTMRTNTLSLNGNNLTFNIVDNGGTQYDLLNFTDATGIDFSFAGDKELRLGSLDVKGGNYLTLATTGAGQDIFDDGNVATVLAGEAISLSAADGSVGRVAPVRVITTNLTLSTDANLNVVDDLDLAALNLHMTQGGATPGVYTLVAPNLTFNIADNGTTETVTDITDTTGINLSLQSVHSQSIQVIDVQPYGTVNLYTNGEITGSGSPTARITAALAAFETTGGGAIGTLANPIELSAPRVVLRNTGDINIDSDTHIDNLAIYTTHGNDGTYAISSPDLVFTVTDGPSGANLTNIVDTTGLTLTYLSDHDMTIGTIDLGIAGDVTLGSNNDATMDLLGDGNTSTAIHAVGVNLNSAHGAVGAAGTGNEIDVVAQHLRAYAGGGGVFAAFGTDTVVDSIGATASSVLTNPGDIRLGSIDMNGSDLEVDSGGSILSGSISRTAQLTLNAVGSVGNESAITTNAVGNGTTTLIVNAGGSVAVHEGWTLDASNVVGHGDIELTSGRDLTIGTIDADTGVVTLSSSQGNISGNSGANLITGSEVSMTANYGSGVRSIGSGGTAINIDAQKLALNARGDMVVTDTSDLAALSITRNVSSSGAVASTLSVGAQNLTFNVTDDGTTTTINNVTDTTGLDFTLFANDGIAVNTLNAGSGTVVLDASRYNGVGSIVATGGGTITAGDLTLASHSSGVSQTGSVGTGGTALRTAAATITATAQQGGIFIAQAGNTLLKNLQSGGALTVTASSGDLSVGTLSYGNNQALNLTAAAGSMLDDGDLATGINTSGSGAVNLSAANGFGTQLTPLVVNANSNSTLTANVTGAGTAHLEINSNAAPIVNVTAANGAIDLRANGNQTLASLVSTTDAVGNDVVVTGTSGNVTVGTVTAGALHGLVNLQAGGQILGRNGANSVSGYTVGLNAPDGVGTLGIRLNVTGQNIVVFTEQGDVYLAPTATAVLGYVQTHGGLVNINGTADIVAGNIITNGGAITLATNGSGARIFAGNVDAGSGGVTLTATNGNIIDDGLANTTIIGGAGNFTASTGIGTGVAPLQTNLGSLTANVTGAGGIFIAEIDALTLGNLTTANGAITIDAPGLIDGAGTIAAGSSGNIAITSANDDVLLNSNINNNGGDANNAKVTITGNNIAVNAVSSTGDQQYLGDTVTIGGNVAARSVLVDGDLVLGGSGSRTFNTSALGGDVVVNGAIDGAGHGLTINAGAGDALIDADGTDLGAVTITASDINVHSMTGTGTQTYTGNVTFNSSYVTNGGNFVVAGPVAYTSDLSVDTAGGLVSFSSTVDGPGAIAIDAATGAVTFTGALGGITRVGAVTVDTAGLTTFGGVVRAASVATDIPGTLSIAGPTVDTTGTQSWGENLTLNNDKTFIGSTVTFQGNVDATTSGVQGLTVTGDAVFAENVGDSVALKNIVVSGNVGFGGHIATTTTQTYGAAATLVGDTVIDVGSGGLVFNGTVAGPYALTVNAGNSAVSFTSTIGDAGTRLGDLAINTAGATTFGGNIYATSIATDVPGTVALNADIFNTTGTQTYGENITLNRNIVFTGSTVEFTGTVNDSGAGQHALNIVGSAVFNDVVGGSIAPQSIAVSGIATLNGGTVTSAGTQNYGGLILGDDTVLNATSVVVAGPVDGVVPDQQSLTVNGNAAFGGAIGASVPLEALTVNGNASLAGNVATATGQSYNGALLLTGDTILDAASGGVNFAGTVDGSHALTVNAGTDAVTFAQPVGGSQRLGALTVNTAGLTSFDDVHAESIVTDGAGTIALNGTTMDTTGAQVFGENILIGHDIAFIGTTVVFDGLVDDATPGTHTLSVTGNAVFNDAIGGTTPLRNVAVTGNATVNGGAVTTTATQSYGSLVLGDDTTLTGTAVSVAGPTDADATGRNLTVNGAANFGGRVGGTTPLQTLTVTGPAHLDGGVATDGAQNYGGAITLDGDSTLDIGSGGLVLDVAVDGPHALTVNVGAFDAVFNGAVGRTARIGALTVNSDAATVFNNSIRATSVATDAGGSVALNGGTVDTTGTQVYADAATIGTDTTLTGGTIAFHGPLDDSTAGQHALSIQGNAIFMEPVGATAALRSLAVSGASAVNGGSVSTTGNQSYGGDTTLGSDTTFDSSGGSVTFGGSIVAGTATPSLNIAAPNGTVGVAGAMGSLGAPLGRTVVFGRTNTFGSVDATELVLNAGTGATTFNGPLNAHYGTVTVTSRGGPVSFNAPVHTATGFNIIGPSPVYLGGNLSVDEGPISIDGRLILPRGALRIRTNGDITLHGVAGANTDLRMAAGHGFIRAGIPGGAPEDQVALRTLQVDSASGALFYGTLGGRGGVIPATRVRGGLVGDPYFFNDTPWGPLELIDTLATHAAAQDAASISRYAAAADRNDSGEYPNAGIVQDLIAQRSDDLLKILPASDTCTPSAEDTERCEVHAVPVARPGTGRRRNDL